MSARLCLLPLELIYVLYKCSDLLQVVERKLLDVVVASTVYIVRRVLVFALLVHFFSVVKRDNFISSPMDYVNRTINVLDAIDIWKLVKR